MKTNVGNADRTLRLVAGVTIIALGVVFQSWWGAIGLIPLFTGTTPLVSGLSAVRHFHLQEKIGHPSIQSLAAFILNA